MTAEERRELARRAATARWANAARARQTKMKKT